ncbi:MAG: hypothetical protein QE263_00535 [Vampirovibrionales bacterium]|jgi:hypothetical protein|nr:hypothetical protein [Vampirovibrionales bacterium]
MPYKPMKLKDYLSWIQQFGWTLVKGSIDWKLLNAQGKVIKPNIIVTHPGKEVIAKHVADTRKLLALEGFKP